ncbi:HAD family hydrolase [Aliikangiella sp. IMCC44632]
MNEQVMAYSESHSLQGIGIIFDLDGTLLDTVWDISSTLNWVLSLYGLPTHNMKHYVELVGMGSLNTVKKSIRCRGLDIDALHEQYLNRYESELTNDTRIYPGVNELLKRLIHLKAKLFIQSNKMQSQVNRLVSHYFPNIPFEQVIGAGGGYELKPSATATKQLVKRFNLNAEKVYFVGDSEVDMQTGAAAKVSPVGVSWGYRNRHQLRDAGAKHIITTPEQLVDLIIAEQFPYPRRPINTPFGIAEKLPV